MERLRLLQRQQHRGESIDSYHQALSNLMENADAYQMTPQDLLATLFTAGLSDAEMQAKVVEQSPFPPYKEVLTMCRALEKGKISSKQLQR